MTQAKRSYIFTSESVTEGHPDKMCDQISDAILDAIIKQETALEQQGYVDKDGVPASLSDLRCAAETMATSGTIVISGEIRTQAYVDVEQIAREVICNIGYDSAEAGFDGNTCGILNVIHEQSADIAAGVDASFEQQHGAALDKNDTIGAGDQGMMFGYACNETPTLMPLPIYLSHRLAQRLALVRKNGEVPDILPDGKVQVSVLYEGDVPKEIKTILISTQHKPHVELEELRAQLVAQVINPILVDINVDKAPDFSVLVNPTGRFTIGGPVGDVGLTGRKIIVDTYGGMGRHGGGAFSGKDCTKVDRSAAYAARYVAKNVVAAGLATRCEVQIAYAIGMARPVSIMVDTFGPARVDEQKIEDAIKEVFDLRPAAIIEMLDLRRPIYQKTSAYGHFGRELPEFSWERTDRVDELKKACGA